MSAPDTELEGGSKEQVRMEEEGRESHGPKTDRDATQENTGLFAGGLSKTGRNKSV